MPKITVIFLTLVLAACGTVPPEPSFDPAAAYPPGPQQLPPIHTATPDSPTPVSDQPPDVSTVEPTQAEPGGLEIFASMPGSFTGTLLPGQQVYEFVTGQNDEIHFLMYLPYSYDPRKKWPLILFLHSSLEVGTDLDKVRERALPEKLENEKDFPFIVVSPQISQGFWYTYIDELEDLLTQLENTLPVDNQRVYLTGFSLGGYGTWAYARIHPERFAAIAPVAGSLDEGTDFKVPIDICTMDTVPVWAFHGANDVTVNPDEEKSLVNALSNCGDETRLTIYSETGHLKSGELAYADPALYDWLLEHKK